MHCSYNESDLCIVFIIRVKKFWLACAVRDTCHKQFVGVCLSDGCLMERERERDTERDRDNCILCQEHRQSLLHILNTFRVAMGLRRYSERHDSVLKVFGEFIEASLPPHSSVTIDLPTRKNSFPHHITPTNLRPNTVWWCERQRELWLFELTISSESLMAKARELKKAK